jgi:hypothetical protein
MENKPLSCPFCGSTKILTDIRHQIASFPTPKAIIRINWCTCYECGASSSLDAWQKRALSERNQRLVEAAKGALELMLTDSTCFGLGVCKYYTECTRPDGECQFVLRLQAALAAVEG